MSYKKAFSIVGILIVFGLAFNFSAPTARADIFAEIQRQIQLIQEQIAQLQWQLGAMARPAIIAQVPAQADRFTLSLDRSVPDRTGFAAGTTSVPIARFSVIAPSNRNVTVFNVSFTNHVDTGRGFRVMHSTDLRNFVLWDESEQRQVGRAVSGTTPPHPGADTGSIVFDGFSLVVPAGTTRALTLRSDISPNATVNNRHAISIRGVVTRELGAPHNWGEISGVLLPTFSIAGRVVAPPVPPPAINQPPIANAGPATRLVVGTSYTHSGAWAFDADNNLASYTWSWGGPCPVGATGGCPTLSGNVSGTLTGGRPSLWVPRGPTFTPTVTGSHTLRLTVRDAAGASRDATVVFPVASAVTPPPGGQPVPPPAINVPPVVNAGRATNLVVGTSYTHSGAWAFDADNNLASYTWSWGGPCPVGATGGCPTLSGNVSGTLTGGRPSLWIPRGPTFTPREAGTHTLRLTVRDTAGASRDATVVFPVAPAVTPPGPPTPPNRPPGVDAGPVETRITVGSSYTHSGAWAVDTENNLSRYEWSWVSCPVALADCPALSGNVSGSLTGGHNVVNIPNGPTFTPRNVGQHMLRLTVTDTTGASDTDTVWFTAVTAPLDPPRQTNTLSISVSGQGRVTGPGINCPGDCAEAHIHGLHLTLTVRPDAGWRLDSWGGGCSGASLAPAPTYPICRLVMTQNRNVTATFTRITPVEPPLAPMYTLSIPSILGWGTVTSTPTGINCGAGATTCRATYPRGTSVRLVATPASGWSFSHWTGDCTTSDAVCSVTMSSNRETRANFIQQEQVRPPMISTSPPELRLPGVMVNERGTGPITVRNIGGQPLSGNVFGLTAPFSCVSGCTYNIPPGGTHEVRIQFHPTSEGSFQQVARFSGGGGSNVTVLGATVRPPTLTASLTANPTSGTTATIFAFTAARTGGTATGAVTFTNPFCGTGGTLVAGSHTGPTDNTFSCTYATAGARNAAITVTQGGVSFTPNASVTVTVSEPPPALISRIGQVIQTHHDIGFGSVDVRDERAPHGIIRLTHDPGVTSVRRNGTVVTFRDINRNDRISFSGTQFGSFDWGIAVRARTIQILTPGETPPPATLSWNVLASGTNSTAVSPSYRLVADSALLQSLWRKAHGNQLTIPPVPNVNFGVQTTAALFMGRQPTGGFAVSVAGVSLVEPNVVRVDVRFTRPAPGAIVTQAITSPWIMVNVHRPGITEMRFYSGGTRIATDRRLAVGMCRTNIDCAGMICPMVVGGDTPQCTADGRCICGPRGGGIL